MLGWYRERQRRRRALREARLLLREARRARRRFAHRLTEVQATEVTAAIESLEQSLGGDDVDAIATALNALDERLDAHMSFARKSTVREYTESIAVAVLIALFLRAFVVEAFKIPSGSMIPTLQVGDHIFVNKFIYGIRVPFTNIKFGMDYRKPRRGEVAVFIYPREPDKDFIKRIVAVEGDSVEVRDDVLFVNGEAVERVHGPPDCSYEDYEELSDHWERRLCESFTQELDGTAFTTIYERGGSPHSTRPVRIPPRSVFVMGDNRDNSHDSRFWGPVPFELLKGKAMVIWWSAGEGAGLSGVRMGRMGHLVR